MGGSSKKATVGYKYFLGVHMVLCHGPIDFLKRIKVGGKTAFNGQLDHGRATIDKPGLFGGESREGGVSGDFDLESGKPDQGVNDYLTARLGNLVPAFRGVASVVLRQMYIGMNPYIKNWAFTAQRIHTRQDGIEQWYRGKAEISGIPQPWEEVTGLPAITKTGTINAAMSCAYSPGGKYIALAFYADVDDEMLQVFDTGTWQRIDTSSIAADIFSYIYSAYPEALKWAPDGRDLMAIQVSDRLKIINTATWQVITGPGNIFSSYETIGWSPDGQYIVVGEYNGGHQGCRVISTWFWTDLGLLIPPSLQVRDIKFSRDGKYLAVGSDADYLRIFDVSDWSEVANFKNDLGGEARTLSWSKDDKYLAAGVYPAGTAIIDSSTWQVIEQKQDDQYRHVVFSGNFRHLLTIDNSGNDKTYWAFSWAQDTQADIANGALDADFSPSTEYVAAIYNSSPYYRIYKVADTAPNNDLNPAHIIRECLTDPFWGMGEPEADIDDTVFEAAADTLYSEGMGMSLLWDRQQPIEDFIGLVKQHIDAEIYVDITTGLWSIKLIRDDYVTANLIHLDESNVRQVDNASRPAFGELVNSVTVVFWDPVSGDNDTVTLQDIALAQQQGAEINTTIQLPGFTNPTIATQAAQRELKAMSNPRLSATLYVNSAAKDLSIGDPFRLSWPDYGISEMVMRVTDIAYGDGLSHEIRIKCVQDVFALADAVITPPAETEWTDPDTDAQPLGVEKAIEAPYYEIVQVKGQTQTDDLLGNNPDLGYLAIVGGAPQGPEINARFEVDDGSGYSDAGGIDFAPTAVLDEDISPGQEVIAIRDGDLLDDVTIGTWAILDNEAARVDAVSDTSVTLGRGALDTVPAKHTDGAIILFGDEDLVAATQERVTGDQLDAIIRPVTGNGILDAADATVLSVTMDSRAIRPYPPGQFQINATYFPDTLLDDAAITWAHRDRIQQTGSALIDHTDGNIGPEPGTTYRRRIYGEAATLIDEQTGLTGTSDTWTETEDIAAVSLTTLDSGRDLVDASGNPVTVGNDPRANDELRITLDSQRDTYDSWQANDWTVHRAAYGFRYGDYYGG